MNMKKYLLALFIIPVLFLISQVVFAQGANVTNLTPTTDTIWSAGSSNNISWNHAMGFGVGGSCSWLNGLGLIALRSDGTPAASYNMYGQATYGYPGQYQGQVVTSQPFVTAESGTINLPANALPGRYKVVARCQNVTMGNYEGVSAGVVTVSNPSNPYAYYPLIFTSPTAPLNFTAGVDANGVGGSLHVVDGASLVGGENQAQQWVPVGTLIAVKMIKKSDQSTYREWIVPLTIAGPEAPYLVAGAGFNPEDVSTIPAGTYFFRAQMEHNGQIYQINSADLIFTAPAPTASIIITAPVANDYWDRTIDQKIEWRNPVAIPAGTRMYAVLMRPDGTLEPGPAGCRCLGYAAVEIGEIAVSTAGVLRSIPVGSYYVELRAGSTDPGSAVGRSGLFEIGSGPRISPASITITTPKADGTTVWQSNVANTITWQIDGGSFAADRLVAINRFAVSDPSNSLGSAFPLVNDLSYTVPANVLDPDNDPYYYILTIGGVDTRSGNFTVVDDDIPPPPPHRSWAPPLYSPPQCAKPDGSDPDPGCFPPINVSVEPQTKTGPLTVGSLIVDGGAFIRGILKLPFGIGGADIGKVLTLTAADGTAGWRPGGGLPGGTPDNYSCPDGQSIGTIVNGSVTRCEPDDTGGGGPTDPNVWQKRVSSTCAEGFSIRVIDVNGNVTCEEDNTTTDTGSGDITSVKSSGAKSGLTVKNSAIVDGDAVGGEVLSGDAIVSLRRDCAAGQILKWNGGWNCDTDNSGDATGGVSKIIPGTNITISPTGGTGEVKINDTTYAVPDNSTLTSVYTAVPANPGTGFNTFSIKDDGVSSSKIRNESIANIDIQDGTIIGSAKIANRTVTNAKLGLTVARTAACTSPTGFNQYTNCTIPGVNTFCALAQVKGDGGDCILEVSGSTWIIKAGAGVTGQTTCRAMCIPL